MLYIVTLYYNIGRGEGGEKACFRDLGVVSVIKFKIRVCLNRFCPRLLAKISAKCFVIVVCGVLHNLFEVTFNLVVCRTVKQFGIFFLSVRIL